MRHASLALLALLSATPLVSCDSGAPTSSSAREVETGGIRRAGTASKTAIGVAQYTSGASAARLSFIVSNSSSSVTSGWALYRTSGGGGVVMYINVTCLQVSGSETWMSGTVVDSNDSSIEGFDASWKVVDGVPDGASLVNLAGSGEGTPCTLQPEIDTVNISAGTITVT
jgi:hypothetical protein